MKKSLIGLISSFLILFTLGGCSSGSKTDSLLGVYIATTIVSLIILTAYFAIIRKRDLWFILLLASVFVVNAGYLSLAISSTLKEALLANRISYLGSVFLPMSMLMIIINEIGIRYKKALPFILLGVGIVVFLITATPGYLDIYYKEVTLTTVNGVSVLNKVYGAWHLSYLVYLLVYFGGMITIITASAIKKTVRASARPVILAFAVAINIGVWLLEQLVKIDIELLSISYIITELFLLGLNLITQEEEKALLINPTAPAYEETQEAPEESLMSGDKDLEKINLFVDGIASLTAKERNIFNLYLDGKSTRDILSEMNIKENTLKYHNKNIYSKLGVSSRKQLLALAIKSDIKNNK